MSTYIISRCPNKFGNDQAYYVEQSQNTINKGVERFQIGFNDKTNLQELFHSVLDDFAKARQSIALHSAPTDPESKRFGVRRDGPLTGLAYSTRLTNEYEAYGSKLITVFQRQLYGMNHTLYNFQQKSLELDDKALNRKSRFKLEILDSQDPKDRKRLQPQSPDDLINEFEALGLDTAEIRQHKDDLAHATPDNPPIFRLKKEALCIFKAKRPEMYSHLRQFSIFATMKDEYPPPSEKKSADGKVIPIGHTHNRKSHFAIATIRIEIEGKLLALSQLHTWMYFDWQNDPIASMKERSKIYVQHQDALLISTTLKEIAALFEKALQWNRATEQVTDLMNLVATIRYLFAHAVPYLRGSASIAEWLETAIYRFHGFANFRYNQEKLVDLEALTALRFSDFIREYPSMVTL